MKERVHADVFANYLEMADSLRDRSSEVWPVSLVAKRLYIAEQDATSVLTKLCEYGLLSCVDGCYRYDCRSADMQTTVDRLAETYNRRLIQVTNLIHSKPRRIREFADAFKLKKDQ